MRSILIFSVVISLLFISISITAQDKLTIADRAEILSTPLEILLHERLATDGIEFTLIVDMRSRCDYWFVSTYMINGELMITISDCNEEVAGSRNMGKSVLNATDNDKALLIYYAIKDIITEPGTYKIDNTEISTTEPSIAENSESYVSPEPDAGEHRSRYFFAPSSYNLEKGELYYNSLYFLLHDIQYGISDHFSLGMGTTVAGFPFYVTPKLSIPVNDNSAFSIGDMLILGTWNSDFFGNLLYATYTRGGSQNNFSIGGGYLYTKDGSLTQKTNSPVVNISGIAKMSGHIYFISENYMSRVRTKQWAYYSYYDEATQYYEDISESYSQNMSFIYGLTGFRFLNRKKDVVSWQVGLTYFLMSFEDVPAKYSADNWYTYANSGTRFIMFPVIGYTHKFATRY